MLRRCLLSIVFILVCLLSTAHSLRPYLLLITSDDLQTDDSIPSSSSSEADWDEFGDPDASVSDDDHDPGSWRPISDSEHDSESLYSSGVKNLVSAASAGDEAALDAAVGDLDAAAAEGNPHAQSALGFLYGVGIGKQQGKERAFLYHHFAAEGGNMQSKMVLAYTYFRQDMYEKAVKLYAELAEAALASFLISKEPPVIEPIRIHSGTEENKEALRKSRGENNEDFQMTEYQALKGNAQYMFKIGVLYYYGLRGVRRDHVKALSWFSKAVEKREPRAMEYLGEIYARGAGVERNYTRALHWLKLAAELKHYSAYNGLGYLYVKGYGVEQKNFTKG